MLELILHSDRSVIFKNQSSLQKLFAIGHSYHRSSLLDISSDVYFSGFYIGGYWTTWNRL